MLTSVIDPDSMLKDNAEMQVMNLEDLNKDS